MALATTIDQNKEREKTLLLIKDLRSYPDEINVLPKLPLLYNRILALLEYVKSAESAVEAEAYFNELLKIHEILSELLFVHGIQMTPQLRKFIRDCERLDDEWLREYLFKELKNNRYAL